MKFHVAADGSELRRIHALFGDISANSGNNALSGDPEFTAGFLKRHQNLFGSDCGCRDGHGGGVSQPKIVWGNASRPLRIPASA